MALTVTDSSVEKSRYRKNREMRWPVIYLVESG